MSNFFEGNFLAAALDGAWVPVWAVVLAVVCAYFVGNVNPAILIGRARGVDVRAQGSGNAGATNAARSLGKKAGAAVFLIDVAKGWACFYVPYWVFLRVVQENEAVWRALASSAWPDAEGAAALYAFSAVPMAAGMLCGLCVIVGHMYPAAFGFRGGKGVATTFGVLLGVSPLYALLLFGVVILFTALFRRVSLSVLVAVGAGLALAFVGYAQPAPEPVSPMAAAGFHFFLWFMRLNAFMPFWITVVFALVVWKHRANIGRLLRGEESKLSFGKGGK